MTAVRPSTVTIATMARPLRRGFAHRFFRNPIALVSLVWLGVVVIAALFAPVLSPYDPLAQDFAAIKKLPSAAHWLGTDALGRDLLSRLLYGTAPTLVGMVEALVVAGLIGVALGLIAGYFGGRVDRVVSQIIDLVMALPTIVILLSLLAVFNRDMTVAMVILGVLGSVSIARVVRSAVLAVRHELYIEAAQISGLGSFRIIVRHILPRVVGPIIVQLSLFSVIAVLMQTGISFLGLGVQPPAPTWGGMVAEAAQSIVDFPWMLVPCGGAIALTGLALGLIGDVARDTAAALWSPATPPRRRVRRRDAARVRDRPMPEMEADAAAVLVIRDLTVHTTESVPRTLVDNLSLTLRRGETLGIVGESGSGKTLTSLAALGLLPAGTEVGSGTMRYGASTFDLRAPEALRRLRGTELAMIFQEPLAALDPCFTVGHQLAEVVRRVDRGGRAATHKRVIELLERVKIVNPEQVARRYPHQISGGMAQRIGIARALAGRPHVLFADEPSTALDVTVQQEILALLHELLDSEGMAMIFVTHDWGVVADICDRALVLYRGEMVEEGTVDDIFYRPTKPYTKALLESNPHLAAPGEYLPTVEETLRRLQGANR